MNQVARVGLYETKEDLSREWSAVADFGLYVNERIAPREFMFQKIQIVDDGHPCLDFWIRDVHTQEYVGALEFKYRQYSFEHINGMGGLFLTGAKYDYMMSHLKTGHNPVLLVSFQGDLRYIPLHLPHDIHGGMQKCDRANPPTQERVVYFTNASNWVRVPTGEKI